MGYTALYRKFRPDNFSEVKGQDHIVKTLRNQIQADRIGHAYLFCGTRGTVKTSIAKIFARAVNCEHPVDGNLCNQCSTCRAIAAGSSMNVIEIDAASNNGVDNIREIREEVDTLTLGLNTLINPYGDNYSLLVVGSFFSSVPIFILFVCFLKYFIEGMTAGAVKE